MPQPKNSRAALPSSSCLLLDPPRGRVMRQSGTARADNLLGNWAVLFIVCFALTSGCASIKLPSVPNPLPEPDAESSIPPLPPLADPADQSLAIALNTAELAEQRGMDREAIESYLVVRQHEPDRPGVAHSLAVLYDRSGRVDDAAAEYRRALTEQPGDPDLHCDHGYFLYSAGRTDEAAASYRRALELDSDHRQSKINLGLLLAHQGNDDEATQLFTDAIGPAAACHNLGMIKLQRGEHRAARALLAEAAARDPSVAKKSSAVLATLDETSSQVRQVGSLSPRNSLHKATANATLNAY